MNQNKTMREKNELVETLIYFYKNKLLIFAITLFFTAIATAHSLLLEKKFAAPVRILPPKTADVVDYNILAQIINFTLTDEYTSKDVLVGQAAIKELTTDELYDVFLKNLKSLHLMQTFVDENYKSAKANKEQDQQEKINEFKKLLKIHEDSRSGVISTEVTIEDTDRTIAAKLSNRYVQLALELTEKEVKEGLQVGATSLANLLQMQADSATHGTPMTMSSKEDERSRKIKLLRSIEVDKLKIRPATIDSEATPPNMPSLPNKNLIINLGLILGLIVSLLVCSIKKLIDNGKHRA